MGLVPNSKLGPYEVLAPLGAGGMGEVYRARDTRLDREVAIKVLPAHLTRSLEFKQRFEREAKSISQLTHPNICTLHDVGHHDGTDYLVMELLEGESLAARLTKGALPLEQVLRVGIEVASALDAAHRKGVVHRDLKPGNVMLTKSGAKLLDFGLAKSAGLAESDPSAVTVSQPLTTKGTILGTFQYMAPEQLEGSEADARTDLFAYGAVLYEMATGKRAFEGVSRASLIASIMSSQPRPIGELQPMTPPPLDRLIRKCLAKDPDSRWQTAADVADELRWIKDDGSRTGIPAAMRAARKSRERFWATCSVVLGLGCVILSALVLGRRETPARRVWSTISPPEGNAVLPSGDLGGPVAISSDGTTLAFAAGTAGVQQLWVRPLGSDSARVLPGTEGAVFPFWSADSKSLGYFAKERLYTISASGGPAVSICDASGGRGGAWNREGVILVAPAFRSAIFRIPATGGVLEPVTKIDESKHTSHRWPTFCPDGKHFLYLAVAHGTAKAETNALYLGSIDGGEPKLVMNGSANAAMVGDRLLFPRENTLLAARFDLEAAKLIGDPTVVATGVMHDATVWRSGFSVSRHGELAFHSGTTGGEFQPAKRGRAGEELGEIGASGNLGSVRLSPDGTKLATSLTSTETDLWTYDLARGMRSRLTFGGVGGANLEPVWTSDSQTVIYATIPLARPGTPTKICRRPAMGGDEEILFSSDGEMWPMDLSSDGKYLLLGKGKYIGGDPCDIWVLSMEGQRAASPLIATPFIESNACFSPDGKWVAFSSSETGTDEVYAVPFRAPVEGLTAEGSKTAGEPVRGGRWQVSTRGGSFPRWIGKEIFFVSGDSKLTAVEVTPTSHGIEIGQAKALFTTTMPAGVAPFDVSPDGQWFVETAGTSQATLPINLITNWDAELTTR